MNDSAGVLNLARNAIEVATLLAAPLLLSALLVGLLVSVLQAATQINEATLSFVPKLIAVFGAIVIGGPWMIDTITGYMRRLFESIPQLIGG